MIQVRRSKERGHAEHGWLKSFHTFSFADYYDSQFMGFSALRVINEDFVQPGQGFATHSHRDMEIITYVVDGLLEHKDSMGNGSIIHPEEIQYMSAGSGVTHSEFNASNDRLVHLYQIWIRPALTGQPPRYAQLSFPLSDRLNRMHHVVGPELEGEKGNAPIQIRQDASIYLGHLEAGRSLATPSSSSRNGWIQVVKGSLRLSNHEVFAGDGVFLQGENTSEITSQAGTEFLFFDLP